MTVRLFPAVALLIASFTASAADYPTRPVRLVVPFAAGGAADIMARLVSGRLAEALGQPVAVDNRPGAGGLIGADFVAKAPPDGYTILFGGASTYSINRSLYSTMPFDSATAFAPITQMSSYGNVLVVDPSLPVTSVRELIAYGKSHPGKLNFASTGAGGSMHLSGEMFKSMAGIEMTHVPYKAGAAAHVDILGGQVQVMFDAIHTALPQIRAGKLRALGVTAGTRSPLLPEVPTIAESGLPEFAALNWFGFAAPAGTPKDVVDRLNREIVRILQQPELKARLLELGAEPVGNAPEAFAAWIQAEAERWGKIVRALGLKAD